MTIDIPSAKPPRFRRACDIRWTVEKRGLAMFTHERGVFCCIPYPFAAIWDLAERGYELAQIVELMRHIAGLDHQATHELVVRTMHSWAKLKLLVEDSGNG